MIRAVAIAGRRLGPAAALLALGVLAPAPSGAQEAVKRHIQGQGLAACWTPPVSADGSLPAVRVKVSLKRDGSLDGEPEILDPSGDPRAKAAEAAAVRAVRRCSPMSLPAESYSEWRHMIVTFDPSELK